MSIEICSSLIANHPLCHTDTHITQPLQQSNRCCGSPASRHCSAREQGDVDRDLVVISSPIHSATQTLTSLDLQINRIGAVGAQHLATALRENKVMSIEICSSLIANHSLSHTDTHITRPRIESNRCCGSPASRHCSAREQGDVDRDLVASLDLPSTLPHRHSHHSTSSTIKSVLWEPSISPLLCERTR